MLTDPFEAQAAGEKRVFLRLLYPTGQAFSSSNMSYWQDIAIRKEAIDQLFGGAERVIETVILSTRKDHVRILYAIIGPGIILPLSSILIMGLKEGLSSAQNRNDKEDKP